MIYRQLTPEQAKRVRAVILKHRRYLSLLLSRMDQLRFPPDDPLRTSTKATRDASDALDFVLEQVEAGV
jgi:hypothetical protein